MSTTRRIALLLFVVFLIPALFFSLYEMNSLSQDEATIEEIYKKQLEAILFSANQYTDDILNSWITSAASESVTTDSLSAIEKLLTLTPAIKTIATYDTTSQALQLHQLQEGTPTKSLEEDLKEVLSLNHVLLGDLMRLQKQGFQKIAPLWLYEHQAVALLYRPGSTSAHEVKAFVVDPNDFLNQILGPRLQYIAQDRFDIIAFNPKTDAMLYYTASGNNDITPALTEDLWLFPGYKIGISTRGQSVSDIISERTQTNLLLLILLDIVLIVGLILTFRNIKKELRLAQNKSEFVSNVSHELRTPLALISMFAETLEMGRVPHEEKKKEYYSIINKETRRLTGLVNKILSFSQLDAGKKTFNMRRLNLSQLCHQLLDTYGYHLEKAHFDEMRLIEADIYISADEDALTELIINLIDNAIKYSGEVKWIQITVTRKNGKAILAVADKGTGISKSDQPFIFDKFYRAPAGDLATKQGTGIGLALVKAIADAHGADIQLISEPGNGAEFLVYFEAIT